MNPSDADKWFPDETSKRSDTDRRQEVFHDDCLDKQPPHTTVFLVVVFIIAIRQCLVRRYLLLQLPSVCVDSATVSC